MNILTDILPDSVMIDGKKYPVRTDFRVWLEFDRVLALSITEWEKAVILTRLCFDTKKCRKLPDSFEKAATALCNFYLCRQDEKKQHSKKTSKERVFSFEEDADYIYAAFITQYGIDLTEVKYMHWYKFSALFKGLDENCRFMKIISWRGASVDEIQDEGRRKYIRKMKELYALPDNRTELEKQQDMADAISELF